MIEILRVRKFFKKTVLEGAVKVISSIGSCNMCNEFILRPLQKNEHVDIALNN
jgi:hypothetical protein